MISAISRTATARLPQPLTPGSTKRRRRRPPEREARLTAWDKAPAARACHPREEHLLPLMVVAGAAGESQGKHEFRDVIGGKTISGFRFG